MSIATYEREISAKRIGSHPIRRSGHLPVSPIRGPECTTGYPDLCSLSLLG